MYTKLSHFLESALKKNRGRCPLQFPSTFSIEQASRERIRGLVGFGGVGGGGDGGETREGTSVEGGLGGSGSELSGVVATSSLSGSCCFSSAIV